MCSDNTLRNALPPLKPHDKISAGELICFVSNLIYVELGNTYKGYYRTRQQKKTLMLPLGDFTETIASYLIAHDKDKHFAEDKVQQQDLLIYLPLAKTFHGCSIISNYLLQCLGFFEYLFIQKYLHRSSFVKSSIIFRG